VFLDESTSMLDLANESYLYKLLRERLPNCSIITVAHHASVDEFHDEVIDMAKYSHATSNSVGFSSLFKA
jgi:putative ATP-binding cassette transporter